jgi:hypothetical protein
MRSLAKSTLLVLSFLCTAVPVAAGPEDEFLLAREALAERSFAEAIDLLGRFREAHPESPLAAEAQVLRARAWHLWGRNPEAVRELGRFIDENPQSPWAARARLLMAEAFVAEKRFADASEVYRIRIDFLRGDAYLDTVSGHYLEIADAAYEGERVLDPSSVLPKEILQRDFQKAWAYYSKARTVYLPPKREAEVSFRIGHALIETGRPPEAVAELEQLLGSRRDPTGPARPAIDPVLEAQAYFELARAYQHSGRRDEAIATFLRLEKDFLDHPLAPKALLIAAALQLEAASGASGDSARRTLFDQALKTWDRLLARFPQHELAPDAAFTRAEALAGFGDADASIRAFLLVVKDYPRHAHAPAAQLRVADLERGRARFDAAVAAWKTFLSSYPNDPRWSGAQQAIVRALYDKGLHLLRVEKKPSQAREVWDGFLAEHPLSELAPVVYFHFYEMSLPAGLGPMGPVAADEKARAAFEEALRHLQALYGKYPQSGQAPLARLLTAQYLQNRLDDLDKAIAEFEALVQNYPSSPEAGTAQSTLGELRRKHLKLTTPKVFTADGPWRLEVETRNIPRLRFKAYRLNVEEYFRRKHALDRIEDVVVGVVEPTKTWEIEVPAYRPYRLLGGERELPLERSELGAYILSVEDVDPPGTAAPATLELGPPLIATTLLVRSNLAFVTKHAAESTLVWAFDEVTGKPFPGARILLSSGSAAFAEGVTDAQGVFRAHYGRSVADPKYPAPPGPIPDLRVLAVAAAGSGQTGAHVAFDRAQAGAVSAYGYSTKVHVTTDRPLYRSGQMVHFRAILRRAAGGRYESSEGEKALVKVTNPLGVVLFEEELAADAFGTLSGEVGLTAEPPLGDYSVAVRYREQDFAAAFKVEEYRKPEFAVSLVTARSTYLPGEAVRGHIRADYLFGAPVAGAAVAYRVFEGPFRFDSGRFDEFRWFFSEREKKTARPEEGLRFVAEGSGVTDAEGKLAFEYLPQEAPGDRVLVVAIDATDLSRLTVSGAGRVIVARQGVQVLARADRKVYRPGDRAMVSFRTVDAASQPVDAEGEAVLLRRRSGTTGTVETGSASASAAQPLDEVVRTQPFATKAGQGELALSLERPGEYLLAFRTRDRAGTLCEGGALLRVAGDEPDLRKEARLLAAKAVYRQGEEATLYLNSPAVGRHALLTFEGLSVVDYRVFEVTAHSQELQARMQEAYSPNVHVAVAIPHQNKLYEASDELIVLQFLNVAVEAEKAEHRPGEEVELKVTAADQGGQPVEASLSLAVVDQSIFELQPPLAEEVKSFFYDQRRQRGVSSSSSYSFRYDGVTRVVESAVLEEYLAREQSKAEAGAAGRVLRLAKADAKDKALAAAMPRPGAPATAGAAPAEKAKARAETRRRGAEFKKAGDSAGLELAAEPEALEEDEVRAAGRDATVLRFDDDADRARKLPNESGLGGVAPGALVEPAVRRLFADTAHWNPSVRTGKDGTARVKFQLPDNLTTWRATAVGATRGSHFGEAEARFRTRKDLLVRLQAPRFLNRGDRARIVTPVHNYSAEGLDVDAALEGKGVDVKSFASTRLKVGAGEARALEWELAPPPASPEALPAGLLRVKALTVKESDALEEVLPVSPFGKRHAGGEGGLLADTVVYDFDLDEDFIPGSVELAVDVYPHHSEALLQTVLYLRDFPYGCVEQTVSGFLPAIALQSALNRLGTPREDLRRMLRDLVPKRIVQLLNLQRPSGGWAWWGQASEESDPEMTALALLALERSRLEGYRVQADRLDLARKKAQQLAQKEEGLDRQALLLYALSFSRSAPAEGVNRLHRYRERLGSYALALLVLAVKAQEQHGVAAELAGILRDRVQELAVVDPGRRHAGRGAVLLGSALRHPSTVEASAYALLALDAVEPGSAAAERIAEGLLALRRGVHWGTTKASAAAVLALAGHAAQAQALTAGSVEVLVGGEVVESLKTGPAAPRKGMQTVRVPPERLQPGRNRVELRREGAAPLAFAVRHEHFTPADAVEEDGNLLRASRRWESFVPPRPMKSEPVSRPPLDPRRDPRDVLSAYAPPEAIAGSDAAWLSSDEAPQPGFRIIAAGKRPALEPPAVRWVQPGEKFRVVLTVTAREDLSYVQVEDPIPAGCEVVNDSDERFTGTFDRREVRDDKVVFFRSQLPKGAHALTYLLRPTFPGAYRALPALAACMYEPGIAGTSRSGALEIAAGKDAPEPAAVELSADEKLYRAERAYLRLGGPLGAAAAAAELQGLYREVFALGGLEDAYRDLALARITALDLAASRHRQAVEGVEALRRRNPNLIAGAGDLLAVAGAYRETGEHRQGLAYQQALLDLYYLRDREVGEHFFALAEQLRAQAYGLELVSNYPSTARVVADAFELSKRYAAISVAEPRRGTQAAKKARFLHQEAAESLSRFIAYFPASPFAPAAQQLVVASLESLGEPAHVVDEALKFERRYPNHHFLDEVLHAALKADFARGRYDRVVEKAPQLIEREFPRPDGKKGPSEHAPSARYLLAQSHHVLGDLPKALEAYRAVAPQFPDAAAAVEHLTAKTLSAPQVVHSALSEEPVLEVEWKNLSALQLKVYRVDLPLLFAVRKDLRSVSAIDLTGIDPVKRLEQKLEGKPFTPQKTKLSLPTKDKGVYLVAGGAEGREFSTIVVRSDLKLEVQRSADRLRVHLLPRGAAAVKVSDGASIVASGKADARGIFEAVVAPGRAAVLAEREGHFALYTE